MTATAIMASAGLGTAETYLDTQPRQQNFATKLFNGNHDYPGASSLSLNQFALKGPWNASQSRSPRRGQAHRCQARSRPRTCTSS